MHLRAIVIDDEELARKRLRKMLQSYEKKIEVVGEAENGQDAVDKIETLHPDLIFLDVQMPGFDGFEVVRRLRKKPFIVFTTAYDEYALKAFEENSIDYLLKPIEQKRLDKAVEKLERVYTSSQPQINENLERLLSQLASPPPKRLHVKSGDKILLIDIDSIVTTSNRKTNTRFSIQLDQEHIVELTLAEFEEKLDKWELCPHSSLGYCERRIHSRDGEWFGGKYKVRLKDKKQTELVVSRGYVDRIRNL